MKFRLWDAGRAEGKGEMQRWYVCGGGDTISIMKRAGERVGAVL